MNLLGSLPRKARGHHLRVRSLQAHRERNRRGQRINSLIYREYNGTVFTFREDGYFNMTKAAKAFGKDVRDFLYSTTKEYIEALSNSVNSTDLIETSRGRHGGTWGHPKLAVFFARWLDPKFAVFCDAVIDDILSKKAELTITQPEQSMTMQVPQTFPEALRLAA